MNEIIFFRLLFLGLAYHVIFSECLAKCSTLSGKANDVTFHGFEHCAQKQKEQMQKGWKYPKQCYKKTLLFFILWICVSPPPRWDTKKLSKMSQGCVRMSIKKFQRIPSRNGCQFPVMTFGFLLRINFLNWDYTVGKECKITLVIWARVTGIFRFSSALHGW